MESTKPTIALYAQGMPSAVDLAAALEANGARVRRVDGDCGSAEAAQASFAPVVADVDYVVMAVAPDGRGAARPLLDWSADDWRRCSDETQLALAFALMGLHGALAGRPCQIVLIGGTVGLTGARNHVALATATEGQRGLMKSIARQWGPQIRLNWLSVSTPLLFPDIPLDGLPEQCELGDYTPSLGKRPEWVDVARAVMMLGSPNAAGITGQMLIVDGGEWMLP